MARGLAFALSLLAAPPALAAPFDIETRSAAFDRSALAPLLARGELALIESTRDGALRQVVLLTRVAAPREKVFDTIMEVERYPSFLHTIEKSRVVARQGPVFEYYWKLDVPMITLEGTRLQRGRRPDLVEVRGKSGNFQRSRERWELYELGPSETLVAFYRTLDIDTGGLILKTMAKLEPSMEKALSVGSGFVHLRELTEHLAGRSKPNPSPRTGPVPPFRRIELGRDSASERLRPLMQLGQLVLIESSEDGGLDQVSLLTVVDASAAKLSQIVKAADDYPKFIPTFAEQSMTALSASRFQLDWELEVPFENLEGRSIMSVEPDGSVDIVAEDGDIKRARWRWEFFPVGADKVIPVHYAYTDVKDASFFIRRLLDKQPLFQHGLVIASATVGLEAMKARAEGRR